jgi:threonine/homoserine/homoserine lactone efflux protein
MSHYLAFVGLVVVLVLIPGPAVMLVMQRAMTAGSRSALGVALGVLTADLVWAAAAAAGVSAVIVASQPAFLTLRLAGAAYLIYLGIRLLVAPKDKLLPSVPAANEPNVPAEGSRRRAFQRGFLCDMTNPKTLLGVTFALLGFGSLTLYSLVLARAGGLVRRPVTATGPGPSGLSLAWRVPKKWVILGSEKPVGRMMAMSLTVEEQRIRKLFDRAEAVEDIAHTLPEGDKRRTTLLAVSNDTLADGGAIRPAIAASLLGLSEKTVRAWVVRGTLTPTQRVPRLLLDPYSVHAVLHIVRELREHGKDRDLLDEVWHRLSDSALLDQPDLQESIEQMHRGEGRVLRPAKQNQHDE